jgi:hypothetical protein
MEVSGVEKRWGLCLVMTMICALFMDGNAYGSGAKAIFFDEGDVSVRAEAPRKSQKKRASHKQEQHVSSSQSYLGISYWIDLMDHQGKFVRTTASRIFRSGDRIKLNLRSNRNGYLYVIGVGSTGTSRVLFPDSEEVANGIKAKVTYAVPFESNLKFDDSPGEEKLLILLSQRPIPQFARRGEVPTQETKQLVASAHVPGAKDLVLEEEVPETGVEPATYAVIPVSALGGKGTLTLQIKLKHR